MSFFGSSSLLRHGRPRSVRRTLGISCKAPAPIEITAELCQLHPLVRRPHDSPRRYWARFRLDTPRRSAVASSVVDGPIWPLVEVVRRFDSQERWYGGPHVDRYAKVLARVRV